MCLAGRPLPARADEPAQEAKRKLTKADIDGMMTSLSNWGRWGADDQRGTINLISPEKRKEAAALLKDGIAISLARPLIKEEVEGSPVFVHTMVGLPKAGDEIASAADEYSVRYHGFTQTHLDGLCHLIYKGKMYNGFAQTELTAKGAAQARDPEHQERDLHPLRADGHAAPFRRALPQGGQGDIPRRPGSLGANGRRQGGTG